MSADQASLSIDPLFIHECAHALLRRAARRYKARVLPKGIGPEEYHGMFKNMPPSKLVPAFESCASILPWDTFRRQVPLGRRRKACPRVEINRSHSVAP